MPSFASLFAVVLSLVATLAASPANADLLQDVKARGELAVGVKDSTPPFGFIRENDRSIVGYDIDIAAAIAKALGVKLKTVPVTSATRIPELMQGRIDLIAATMTHTHEREQQIAFSYTYFVTGQKILVKRSSGVTQLAQLAGKRLSSVRGSTSEQNIKAAVPSATVLAFNDYPSAFLALTQGKVAAMTTDETILLALKNKAPKPDDYMLLEQYVSSEPYGLGMRKGEDAFRAEVNRILVELERSGAAAKTFEIWFGPKSDVPLKRTFKIENDKI